MRWLLLVALLAGAGCAALDNDPILGTTPFRPKAASSSGTG